MSRHTRAAHLALGEVGSAAGIVEGVIELIADGALADGDWLPASRALAAQTGTSRGTVVRAYDELAAAGFLDSRAGSGTKVSAGASLAARAGARTRGAEEGAEPGGVSGSPGDLGRGTPGDVEPASGSDPVAPRSPRDLRPGIPDATLVDERAWRRAVRSAAGTSLAGVNPWEKPSENLRYALVRHLRRHRGLSVRDPLLFDSSRSAVAALCAAFCAGRDPADVPFHIEDPGYRGALLMAREHGLDVRFHPAEPDGFDASRLADPGPAIVYVTPAHQYPLGYRMSVERRAALVRWAGETGSLVIEDDYDGEFRYGVAPLPALATLPGADEHVAYVGTSSKSVSPDLRVAWCAAPEYLGRELRRWLGVHRRGPASLPAETLAALIDDGAMDRHLSRAARVYGERRAGLAEALLAQCPGARIVGVEAGLHLCVLTPGVDDVRLVGALDAAGWKVRALSSQSTRFALSGVILNYARLPRSAAREFARAFAREWTHARAGTPA